MTEPNWKEIAGHLYDELRMRGIGRGDCMFRHDSICTCVVNDCIKEYEDAEEQTA